jgi:hypothetical protein
LGGLFEPFRGSFPISERFFSDLDIEGALGSLIGNLQSGFGLNSFAIGDRLFAFTSFFDLVISRAVDHRVSSEFQAIVSVGRSFWSQLVIVFRAIVSVVR